MSDPIDISTDISIENQLAQIIEAIIFNANRPISEKELLNFFSEEEKPSLAYFREAISELQEVYSERGIELIEVAGGFQFQTKQNYAAWVRKLHDEKPPKYSRALMETLALIAYRQPITRGEIEEIRGVSISSSIFRTLDERGWIRVVGHKDVPGKPGLYATTKEFLNYFCLKSLKDLPSLNEILAEESNESVNENKQKGENLELELAVKAQEELEESLEGNYDQDLQSELKEQDIEELEEIELEKSELEDTLDENQESKNNSSKKTLTLSDLAAKIVDLNEHE